LSTKQLPDVPKTETFEAILRYLVDCQKQLQGELMESKTADPTKVWLSDELGRIRDQVEWAYLRSFSESELRERHNELIERGRKPNPKIGHLLAEFVKKNAA
jgi:hypothetical protein